MAAPEKLKILFFSPFQAIAKHSFPEALLARSLEASGHEITFLGCDTLLGDFCIAHSAYGLTETSDISEKIKVCNICRSYRKALERQRGSFLLLDQFYDRRNDEIIKAFVSKTKPRELYDLKFQDYSVGQIAAYEFLLNYKINNIETLTPDQFDIYKIHLTNTIKVLLSFEKLSETQRFDRVIFYNAGYSVNGMVRAICQRKKTPSAYVHLGINHGRFNDTVYLSWKKNSYYYQDLVEFFIKYKDTLKTDFTNYRPVIANLKAQLEAGSVFTYSSRRSQALDQVSSRLKLTDAEYEKVVLLSMSSSDETYAADFSFMNFTRESGTEKVFSDQISWVRETIEYFRAKPQWKLIVRIHPREFPNKRESVKSSKIIEYEKVFANLPHNVVADTPDLNNSIYDIFDLIDLHLTAQSTTGCESALFGVPGIGCIKNLANYPIQALFPIPKNPEDYFSEIGKVLTSSWDHRKTIRDTLLWSIFFFSNPVIKFDTGEFWNLPSNRFLRTKTRAVRKVLKMLNKPPQSISSYLEKTKITPIEAEVLRKFVEGQEELVQIRAEVDLSSGSLDEIFKSYLIELFSTFYHLDITPYKKFTWHDKVDERPQSNECGFYRSSDPYAFTVEKGGDYYKVFLPNKSRIAKTLADLICS